ncbi:thioredoxin domain-containing protein [Eubacteriales bacterium OttesenSCG-928-M02]|nr:thioredoxin domain-containing protein [Eubacteriales bacterium OttesenSCG-928-M02]
MRALEIFFDYSCPFCLKGHTYLKELLAEGVGVDITLVWCPCEAHPRPEEHGRHSDLTMQGMYYALEKGVDIWAYHDAMYQAGVTNRADIEDVTVLADYVKDILDGEDYISAVESGRYREIQQKGNDYAYKENGVWAVPSYRMGGRKLDSPEGVGITKEALKDFLENG